MSKRARKKKSQSCKNDDHENSDWQNIINTGTSAPVLEEDEDGFPIAACKSNAEFSRLNQKQKKRKTIRKGRDPIKRRQRLMLV